MGGNLAKHHESKKKRVPYSHNSKSNTFPQHKPRSRRSTFDGFTNPQLDIDNVDGKKAHKRATTNFAESKVYQHLFDGDAKKDNSDQHQQQADGVNGQINSSADNVVPEFKPHKKKGSKLFNTLKRNKYPNNDICVNIFSLYPQTPNPNSRRFFNLNI